jgi:hypothetical protein
MFFLALDFILFVFLLHECGRTKYPEQYEDLQIKVMYYTLYMYSMGEELFNVHIYPLFVYDDIVRNNLDLILDESGDNYITDTELLSIDQGIPDEYLFAIYTRLNDNNTVRKKRIYKRLPEDGVYDCDETSYRFVLIEVKYGDTIAKVKFDNAKTNYYVVNNEFDSSVIRYLMATNFDVELPKQYTVCILDHNVNRFEFNETQLLRLNKDDYEVLESESVNDESEKDNDNESNSDNNN